MRAGEAKENKGGVWREEKKRKEKKRKEKLKEDEKKVVEEGRGPPSFAGRPQVYLAATNRKARVHDPTILAKEKKVLAKGMERRLADATLCIGAVVGVGGAATVAAAAAAPAIVRRNVD